MNAKTVAVIMTILALTFAGVAAYLYLQQQDSAQALTSAQATNAALTQREQQALRTNTELQSRINVLETRLNQSDSLNLVQIRELEQELAEQRQAMAASQQAMSLVQADYQDTREALANAQAALAERETELADIRALNSDTGAVLTSLRNELQAARERAEQQQARLEEQAALLSEKREEVSALVNRLDQEQNALDGLRNRLQLVDSERQALVERLENGVTVIKLPEHVLFNSGSAELNEESVATLQAVATALASFPEHNIAVLGHTDSRTISRDLEPLYPTNWELSAARATAAVRVLIRNGVPRDRLRAIGLAETQPLVEEVNEATRSQNRRIEIVLEPRMSVVPLSE